MREEENFDVKKVWGNDYDHILFNLDPDMTEQTLDKMCPGNKQNFYNSGPIRYNPRG